jgi:hypothetical protein
MKKFALNPTGYCSPTDFDVNSYATQLTNQKGSKWFKFNHSDPFNAGQPGRSGDPESSTYVLTLS